MPLLGQAAMLLTFDFVEAALQQHGATGVGFATYCMACTLTERELVAFRPRTAAD